MARSPEVLRTLLIGLPEVWTNAKTVLAVVFVSGESPKAVVDRLGCSRW